MFEQKKSTAHISNELRMLMAELQEDIEFLGGEELVQEVSQMVQTRKQAVASSHY